MRKLLVVFLNMKKVSKILLYTISGLYLIALAYVLVMKPLVYRTWYSNLKWSEYVVMTSNLIPFKTIWNYFSLLRNDTINISVVVSNLVGNILIFIPFGFLAPFYILHCNFKKNYVL